MKDLDFDELDKAVNSLMQTVPEAAPAATSAPNPQPATPVASSSVTTPTTPSPSTAPADPVKPSSNLPEKRSGRFMDVMHPSSDMRSSQQSTPASRKGVSIAPINPDVTPETPAEPTQTPTASEVPAAPVVPEKTEETPAPSDDTVWPDPIEMHESLKKEQPAVETDATATTPKETPDESPADVTKDSSVSDSPKEKTEPVATTTNQPETSSPFLLDAKVEKRPLGGSASSLSEPEKQPESNDPVDAKSEETPKEEVKDTVKPPLDNPIVSDNKEKDTRKQVLLPAELGQEITAIEADTSTSHASKESSHPTTDAGPGNFIPKQYKEKESSGDKEHAAIYDNNTQPLAHPPKKKSGWGVVVLILVLILLGGGGAAALFFLGYI